MILPPVETIGGAIGLVAAVIIAVASKYLLVFRGRHVFNPAALAVAVASVSGLAAAMWWIGSRPLLPFVALTGLAVIWKLRRFSMVGVFTLASLLVMVAVGVSTGRDISTTLGNAFTSWPLVFFAAYMLTEPATMPRRHRPQLYFAGIVGLLFAARLSVGPIAITPEVALLVGNLFALAISASSRTSLKLIKKTPLGDQSYDFSFAPLAAAKPRFIPGQYMELSLATPKNDDRGNRRSFSIASAPADDNLHFGVKFYSPSSRFKQTLAKLEPGAIVYANHVSGDFILPKDPNRKLALFAGGIGITPFHSQIADLLSRHEQRDIVLVYAVNHPQDICYQPLLDKADRQAGIQVIYLATGHSDGNKSTKGWTGKHGGLDAAFINQQIPDIAERLCYVSGPNRMVVETKRQLRASGVSRRHIRSDYFSGY